ncbi:hypothetical protein BDZ89DRAFT_1069660 [Hymenopellis radicata]|nr:hypothetical protein BDZ89DRAFT_1069660 [Hymenopellis radicata]
MKPVDAGRCRSEPDKPDQSHTEIHREMYDMHGQTGAEFSFLKVLNSEVILTRRTEYTVIVRCGI